MDRLIRAKVLLTEAQSLGLTIDDLVAAAAQMPTPDTEIPTVREHIRAISTTFTPGTAATYKSYWRLAEVRYGDHRVNVLDVTEVETLVSDAVDRAQKRRPGSECRSAQENCIGALRALFERAQAKGYIASNPAKELNKPHRLPNNRRALDDGELAEVIEVVQLTSHDPDLDLLLVRFHLESGARRTGALKLRLRDLDFRRSTVWLREKGGVDREQPVSPSLLKELETFARSRGAVTDEDATFRTRQSRPITRRHYNTLFDHVQEALPWTARTPVTAHVLRHTTATAVERLAGPAVAEAFLGHRSRNATSIYTKGTINEVSSALAALTGEPHPLAA